jgi:hypothetical protein
MGLFITSLKIIFSTSGKLPYTLFFFAFQNIPFYTNIIFHPTCPPSTCVFLPFEFHPFAFFSLPLVFAKTSWHKVLEQIQLVNYTFQNNQSKQHECYPNILVCHNVTQVYLPASNIKFFMINLSCAISFKVLHHKRTNMENYWNYHKTQA